MTLERFTPQTIGLALAEVKDRAKKNAAESKDYWPPTYLQFEGMCEYAAILSVSDVMPTADEAYDIARVECAKGIGARSWLPEIAEATNGLKDRMSKTPEGQDQRLRKAFTTNYLDVIKRKSEGEVFELPVIAEGQKKEWSREGNNKALARSFKDRWDAELKDEGDKIQAEKLIDEERETRRDEIDRLYAKHFPKQKPVFGTGSDIVEGVLATIKRRQQRD